MRKVAEYGVLLCCWSILLGLFLCTSLLGGCSCAVSGPARCDTVFYRPSYAGGFDIAGNRGDSSRVVRVFSPWQDSDSVALELFVSRNGEMPPEGFQGCVLRDKAERIAVTSTSHIALLDMLGATDRIVAASGKRFSCSEAFCAVLDPVAEIGPDTSPDYEALVASRPDIVLLYGISSESPLQNRLSALGIPYIYIGEYLETSPLGRTEWVVLLAELLGIREEGFRAFCAVADRYNDVKSLAGMSCAPSDRPLVMLNSPYGDSWFLPSAKGYMPNLVRDAGGRYVLEDRIEGTSVPVGLEEAFTLASSADFWLNVSGVESLEQFLVRHPVFSEVPCVNEGKVYANDKRTNPFGGNDFWESSAARADILLADIVRILHPELRPALDSLVQTDGLYYYRQL
ncbi:MAG: ABC transporter substrate-binding protein [Candidatus Cryptobacteroides sp.]